MTGTTAVRRVRRAAPSSVSSASKSGVTQAGRASYVPSVIASAAPSAALASDARSLLQPAPILVLDVLCVFARTECSNTCLA